MNYTCEIAFNCTPQDKILNLERKLQQTLDEHKNSIAHFIKEREMHKVKIAEVIYIVVSLYWPILTKWHIQLATDVNAHKSISRRLQRELNDLKANLKEKENGFQTKLMQLNEYAYVHTSLLRVKFNSV
jgi:hypothetical protein